MIPPDVVRAFRWGVGLGLGFAAVGLAIGLVRKM